MTARKTNTYKNEFSRPTWSERAFLKESRVRACVAEKRRRAASRHHHFGEINLLPAPTSDMDVCVYKKETFTQAAHDLFLMGRRCSLV